MSEKKRELFFYKMMNNILKKSNQGVLSDGHKQDSKFQALLPKNQLDKLKDINFINKINKNTIGEDNKDVSINKNNYAVRQNLITEVDIKDFNINQNGEK